MTVRLLVDWKDPATGREYRVGNLLTTDAATESGLVGAKLADADTTGGTAWIAPAVPEAIDDTRSAAVGRDSAGNDLFPVLAATDPITGERALSVGADALGPILPEIATYAALRAYSGPLTGFYVRGVSSLFDGGAGVFRVDATDTTSADNGGTVLVDASGRRWRREYVGPAETTWFEPGRNGEMRDQIKSVTFSGGFAYLRRAWSASLDALDRIRVYSTDATVNGPVDFYGVRTIPIATENTSTAVLNAYAVGTAVAAQADSIGPLNYNSSYMGANHGPSIAHSITAAGHGKTVADIGSEWSGPSSRKFYILKVVDANTLFVVSNNSGTAAQWAFYATSLAGQTLTHSSGATNAGDIVITADAVAQQITPALNNRSFAVFLDDVQIDHTQAAIYTPQSFRIVEKYSIVSPDALVTYFKANVGANPQINHDSIYADCRIENVHTFHSTGSHTVDQTVTWNSAVNLAYQGVVQDWPPVNAGVLQQYVPGVAAIGGLDYKALVDITASATPFSTPTSTWLDANNPPSRMAQITSAGGVNKVGIVVGYSPITGFGTRTKRRIVAASDAGGLLSAATKKQYPRAVSSARQPVAGESYRMVGYHHVYNCENTPDATVATWCVVDGDIIAVLDFHKTSALTRLALPTFCDGWFCTLIDSQNTSLINTEIIDSGGLAVACTSTYGYAVVKVSRKL